MRSHNCLSRKGPGNENIVQPLAAELGSGLKVKMAASKDVVGRIHECHLVWGWKAGKSIYSAREKWDSRAIGWGIALKIVSGQF